MAATEYRQMRAWCNKICEKHHSDMLETIGKSGTAELPEPTIIETVSVDWAQYQLRSGKVSKIISAHAKIIRDACVPTSTTIPILSAASASRKHNAVQQTREAVEAARARGTGAPHGQPSVFPPTPSPVAAAHSSQCPTACSALVELARPFNLVEFLQAATAANAAAQQRLHPPPTTRSKRHCWLQNRKLFPRKHSAAVPNSTTSACK